MPREITDRDRVVEAVKNLPLTAELFEEQNGKPKYAGDLEVITRGRDYGNGKQVGPYVRLLTYEADEEIMRQGEWGGNTFYIAVGGVLDVYVGDEGLNQKKISQLQPGTCFGEMAVLAGIERNATIKVPAGLRQKAQYMVYGKHHVLCQEGTPIDKVILIKSGWVRRSRGIPIAAVSSGIVGGMGATLGVDFLGAGNCLGIDGLIRPDKWKYSASLMSRTEVLELPLATLTSDPNLRDLLVTAFSGFSNADNALPPTIESVPDVRMLTASEQEISTGIVDGANLLVMDMDLCVRCGNCSLACHKVHGQSRLLRRGIQIKRPVTIGAPKMQHALIPQVCMHCKDPECLTGCPTGAIFRDPLGHVDIDPHTCIGCFDCATQCPYDAISMIPKTDAPVEARLFTKLSKVFGLRPQPVTVPVAGDDLVAIKCNLCEQTPLNPAGARRKAYSCEENCPTGALVRVNPLEYFAEIEATQGLIFQDQTHAIGRNIHKSDPLARAWHIGGAALLGLATVATIWGLAKFGFDGRLGGSWLTMRWITGIVGLGGIAAVMTYPLRKQVYRRRAGALRYWGKHTGGLLTTVLYIAFDVVILSGLLGIVSYIVAPRIMTRIEGEPLLVEDLVGRRDELRQELDGIIKKSEGWLLEEIEEKVYKRFMTRGFLWRQILRREELKAMLAEAREEFKERTTRLTTDDERDLLISAVETAVTLQRVEALLVLHKSLRVWIPAHVISTALMLALMLVHVIQVIFFNVK